MIDLDTVMPGLAVNDFGDAIRLGQVQVRKMKKICLRLNAAWSFFDLFTKGFIEGCNGKLTKREMELLPMGAKVMTFECGMRFLTDYLQGDTYFKIIARNIIWIGAEHSSSWSAIWRKSGAKCMKS